jgi:hypothetical protein
MRTSINAKDSIGGASQTVSPQPEQRSRQLAAPFRAYPCRHTFIPARLIRPDWWTTRSVAGCRLGCCLCQLVPLDTCTCTVKPLFTVKFSIVVNPCCVLVAHIRFGLGHHRALLCLVPPT